MFFSYGNSSDPGPLAFAYFLVNLTARFAYCLGKRDLIACLPIQRSLRLLEDHRRHHYHTRLPHIQVYCINVK
uniref:Uncharacterized protein n=1 Tax=Glossina palpalis gambiensis TaxID=67801 RepID=A0A1B0B682_9MUSC